MKYLKYFETFTNKVVLGIDMNGTINNITDTHTSDAFTTYQPYPDAVNTINNIYEYIHSQGFILNIVTTQPTSEAQASAKEWIDRNGFKYDNIVYAISSSDKWKYADIMVDDSHKVIGNKPLGKVGIKIINEWNTETEGDFNIPNISSLTINLVKQAIDKLENSTTA